MLLYLNLGTKITASAKHMFHLQAVSEDDTIFLASDCISSDMYYRLGVGSTGAVLFYSPKEFNEFIMSSVLIPAAEAVYASVICAAYCVYTSVNFNDHSS